MKRSSVSFSCIGKDENLHPDSQMEAQVGFHNHHMEFIINDYQGVVIESVICSCLIQSSIQSTSLYHFFFSSIKNSYQKNSITLFCLALPISLKTKIISSAVIINEKHANYGYGYGISKYQNTRN